MTNPTPAPIADVLAPCPFCGSHLVSKSEGQHADGSPWFYIECESCAASAEPDVWNRRTHQSTAPSGQGREAFDAWVLKKYGPSTGLLQDEAFEVGLWSAWQAALALQPSTAPAASEGQEPLSDEWCQYVAGMIGAYLGWSVDDSRIDAVAGIIRRRVSFHPAPAPAAQAEQPPGQAGVQPVAWLHPDWGSPKYNHPYSPVTTYEVNGWRPLYLALRPLTRKEIKAAMLEADWPPSLIAPMVETKLVQFAEVIQRHCGISASAQAGEGAAE